MFVSLFGHLTARPAEKGGLACIRSLDIPVLDIVAMLADGMTVDEILSAHPRLVRRDIRQSMLYAAMVVWERHHQQHGQRFAAIIARIGDGQTTDEILRAFPDLDCDDIREALLCTAEAVSQPPLPFPGREPGSA